METLTTQEGNGTKIKGVWVSERQVLLQYMTMSQLGELIPISYAIEGMFVYRNNREYELFLHDYPRKRFLMTYVKEVNT